MDSYCSMSECEGHTFMGGLCAMHWNRVQRGVPIAAPKQERFLSDKERLCAAACNFADADSENDAEYERAWDLLRKAAKQYAAGLEQPATRARQPVIAAPGQLAFRFV